jgi:glycosyltransferase involved in cell wall biosynthesis
VKYLKISILSYDLSHNCLGRAYLLAKVLQRSYDVEIIGPTFGDGIWGPVNTDEFDYVSVPGECYPKFIPSINKMLNYIDGDVIYAIKPKPTSYGIGLIKKMSAKTPLVLDVDDWEVGFSSNSKFQFIKKSCLSIRGPNGLLYTYLMEKLSGLADDVTVSSTFLQNKFGGIIVPHGRDTDTFDPKKFDGDLIRSKYGFSDEKIIMFFGTPRPHKGLEEIIHAMKLIKRKDLKLVIVGANDDQYTRNLKNLGSDIIHMYGMKPFSKVPEFLSMANMIVLPQRNNSSAVGQIPAKVFDAMAMAKPIIATRVSDLPIILDGCGLIVEPGNINALSDSILWVLENETEAKKLGNKARIKCINKYSWSSMEYTLSGIFDKYR